jgi:hypothetical protein
VEIRPATQDEVSAAAGSHPLLPLALDMHGCATKEEMNSNISATLTRGYASIVPHLNKYSGVASLVGSGPSLHETYTDLRGDVFAINQAIGVLLDKGIVPKFAMLWDAAQIVEQFAIPHPDITYLVASRCHPAVFERLKDCRVAVWHAGGDHNIAEVIAEKKIPEPMINGGSAGITRGIYVVSSLGYRDINIFGGDSSYSDDGKTHANGSLVYEKDMQVAIGNNPPHWFRTTPEWCAQVQEYRSIYALFTFNGHTKLAVHGKGMLPFMHELLEAKRNHLGSDKFMEEIAAQEIKRQEIDKSASESFNAMTQPLEEGNHASNRFE